MINHFIIGLICGLSHPVYTSGQLWCYECNIDLSDGPRAVCNDPYVPAPAVNLTACPEDEPYHCLKAVIFYEDILATVRACVPSRRMNTYCEFRDVLSFPNASIECSFCQDYACNDTCARTYDHVPLVVLTILVALMNLAP